MMLPIPDTVGLVLVLMLPDLVAVISLGLLIYLWFGLCRIQLPMATGQSGWDVTGHRGSASLQHPVSSVPLNGN